ncbi:MAG: PEP-CTERM sorting domain-containing protein [Limisphaerales bacterium]
MSRLSTGFAAHAPGLFAALTLLVSSAGATPITLYFNGTVTGIFGIGARPDFAPFHSATTISGTITFEGGDPDAYPGDPLRGFFDGVLLEMEISLPGVGEWWSVNNGWIETWDNTPDIFDAGDAVSFVGGQTGTRIGTPFGNSLFTRAQVSLLDYTPLVAPDMLTSDLPPGSILGWERGFFYLDYVDYSEGFLPTTVRVEFSPTITPIPEPSAFALLLLGGGALGLLRRRRIAAA